MRFVPRIIKDFDIVVLTESDALAFDWYVKNGAITLASKTMQGLGVMYSPVIIDYSFNVPPFNVYQTPHRMAFFQSENFFGGAE